MSIVPLASLWSLSRATLFSAHKYHYRRSITQGSWAPPMCEALLKNSQRRPRRLRQPHKCVKRLGTYMRPELETVRDGSSETFPPKVCNQKHVQSMHCNISDEKIHTRFAGASRERVSFSYFMFIYEQQLLVNDVSSSPYVRLHMRHAPLASPGLKFFILRTILTQN